MELMKPRYIGDGLWISFDGYYYLLHKDSPTNIAVAALEPDVILAIVRYHEDTVEFVNAQWRSEGDE